MKYIIMLLLALPLCGIGQQPIDTCHLEWKAYVQKDKNGEYLLHSDWKPCDYLAIINVNNGVIKITRAGEATTYSIQNAEPILQDAKNNITFKFVCKDEKGGQCSIGLITLAEPLNNYQSFLKIEYRNVTLVYRYTEKEK